MLDTPYKAAWDGDLFSSTDVVTPLILKASASTLMRVTNNDVVTRDYQIINLFQVVR